MFSSLASLLPSLPLSNGHHNHPNPPPFNPNNSPDEEAAETADVQDVEEDAAFKKASGKTRNPNETFIFVRPPPAKSNHPLNLQVQLVPPPQARRESVDEPDTPVTLTRTASNRSDASGYSSTVSFSSTSSSSQGRRTIIPLYSLQAHNVMTNVIVDAGTDAKIAKLQRRGMEFIDLAILEPVEVWAEPPKGTKSSRSATPDPTSTPAASSTTSLSSNSLVHHPQTTAPLRLPEQPFYTTRQSPPQINISMPFKKPANETTKRNIFGKMFRRSKDVTPASPTPSTVSFGNTKTPTLHTPDPDSTPTAPRSATRAIHNRNSSVSLNLLSPRGRSSSPKPTVPAMLQVPGQDEVNGSTSDLSTGGTAEEKILRPPVLGIQPTLSYSYVPVNGTGAGAGALGPIPPSSLSKTARALMYVWFVKRWLKRRADAQDTGLLGGLHASASRRVSSLSTMSVGPAEEGVEVRFEWKRSSGKGKKGKERERGKDDRRGRNGTVDSIEPPKERIKEKRVSRRFSSISHHSMSTNFSVSEEGGGDRSRAGTPTTERSRKRDSFTAPLKSKDYEYETAEEDSDPEDSETPWVCTLKIRRTGRGEDGIGSTSRRSRPSRHGAETPNTPMGAGFDELGAYPTPNSPGSIPQVVRIKVGTLSPTPHHPKLVGMLKVPFPLPDIEVERMGISRRPPGWTNPRPPSSDWQGTTLTAEEIKDVVCSTGLWLVVREGFGGVGRVSRKGDGWRIRA